MGDIRHMSMIPEPRYCPVDRKKVRRGTPKQRERRRNWTMKTAPKSMVRMAKRDMLNMPRMVPRAAKKKLWGWGHWPC